MRVSEETAGRLKIEGIEYKTRWLLGWRGLYGSSAVSAVIAGLFNNQGQRRKSEGSTKPLEPIFSSRKEFAG
jgi:hypothetical protein